jgi:hypothetical protein
MKHFESCQVFVSKADTVTLISNVKLGLKARKTLNHVVDDKKVL